MYKREYDMETERKDMREPGRCPLMEYVRPEARVIPLPSYGCPLMAVSRGGGPSGGPGDDGHDDGEFEDAKGTVFDEDGDNNSFGNFIDVGNAWKSYFEGSEGE